MKFSVIGSAVVSALVVVCHMAMVGCDARENNRTPASTAAGTEKGRDPVTTQNRKAFRDATVLDSASKLSHLKFDSAYNCIITSAIEGSTIKTKRTKRVLEFAGNLVLMTTPDEPLEEPTVLAITPEGLVSQDTGDGAGLSLRTDKKSSTHVNFIAEVFLRNADTSAAKVDAPRDEVQEALATILGPDYEKEQRSGDPAISAQNATSFVYMYCSAAL